MKKLKDLEGVEDLVQIMEAEWGETIDCYVEKKQSETGASWGWRDISHLLLSNDQRLRMNNIFLER